MASSRLVSSSSVLLCPHGAPVTIVATGYSARSPLDGSIPAKSTDVFLIAGCPMIVGATPSPCIRVEWIVTNAAEPIDGVPSLNAQSVGLCLNPSGVPQGSVLMARV